jgi:glycerol-3-phosphate acyltransferase PlsY
MKDIIVVFLIGYALGNIQTSYILGRLLYKVDIRTLGHGNAGTSNAVDSINWKFGLVVAIVDIAKGMIAVLIVKQIYQIGFVPGEAFLLYVGGYGAIIGHIYPIFMNFKGGKGTATLIGVLLGFNPLYGIVGMLIIIIFTIMTDYVTLSTAVLVASVVALTIFKQMGTGPILLSVFGALLSCYLHLPNYKRIAKHEEGRLSLALDKMRRKKR